MPRTRKQTANVVAEVKVPEVLITRQQYIQDIKVRWQIHQTEINNLVEDVKKAVNVCSPYIQKALDYSVTRYQEIRARYVTAQ
jgi:hypothetical protein